MTFQSLDVLVSAWKRWTSEGMRGLVMFGVESCAGDTFVKCKEPRPTNEIGKLCILIGFFVGVSLVFQLFCRL